jgi:Domain of unknown function (DUF4864)
MPMRIAALLLMLTFVTPTVAAGEGSAAQAIIRQQDEALSRDDAASAYALAAPEIHALFPTADVFMAMVKQGYPPVYRHRRFDFGATMADSGVITQHVDIVDANGEAWEAIYTLETQPDGSLKITGCSLRKAGPSV